MSLALPQRDSLSGRVFFALIAGELLFAVVLGVTIGAFSAFAVARQRAESLKQTSATMAAGLMPMIADQQKPQVQAQLSSILEAASVRDVSGIRLRDSLGVDIAREGDWDGIADEPTVNTNPWAILTREQVVEQDVVIDGLRVASLQVRFSPPGLRILKVPTIASLVVLLSIMLVSVPWTAWRLTRDITEPLEDLQGYAARIAAGELDAAVGCTGYGEVAALREALKSMARQLMKRDEDLRGSYEELSDAYARLEQATTEIEQLAAVKSNFVAVAAHELRGPLSTITLYGELLESGELGGFEEGAQDAVSAISSAAKRLASIVQDLMDAALLERGLLPIQFGEVWLEPLLEETLRDASLLGRPRGIELRIGDELPDVMIHGDALRLRQVFDNLLSNAVKYSPNGTAITVSGCETAEHVRIDVADQGRGIPEGAQERLFALFGRLDVGDSRDTAGLGLGLAISARIVEAHGGRISYRRNPEGEGSVFSVSLPLRASNQSARPTRISVVEGGDAA